MLTLGYLHFGVITGLLHNSGFLFFFSLFIWTFTVHVGKTQHTSNISGYIFPHSVTLLYYFDPTFSLKSLHEMTPCEMAFHQQMQEDATGHHADQWLYFWFCSSLGCNLCETTLYRVTARLEQLKLALHHLYPDMCCLYLSYDKKHDILQKEEFKLYTKKCRIKFPYHGGMVG